MSKVLVDRELLEYLADLGDEAIERMGSYLAEKHGEQKYVDAARAILAQPAEAEGVDFGFDDRSVKVSQEAYSIFLARERHHLAALSAVTAERDRLLKDSERLDFMLSNTNRKVVAERIGGGFLDIYVEEGFMGDEQYPPVKHKGDWKDGSEATKRVKRAAIDAAMAAKEA